LLRRLDLWRAHAVYLGWELALEEHVDDDRMAERERCRKDTDSPNAYPTGGIQLD